jgi:hypothetical protein
MCVVQDRINTSEIEISWEKYYEILQSHNQD